MGVHFARWSVPQINKKRTEGQAEQQKYFPTFNKADSHQVYLYTYTFCSIFTQKVGIKHSIYLGDPHRLDNSINASDESFNHSTVLFPIFQQRITTLHLSLLEFWLSGKIPLKAQANSWSLSPSRWKIRCSLHKLK